jgi:hypothetical protein
MPALVERNQPGRREDLSDRIAMVDAKATPLVSMLPKDSEPTNVLMEWQADEYPDVRIEGVVDEADTTNYENLVGRVSLKNRVQIFERAPKVSRLANGVSDVAGIGKKKEFAKSVAKAIIMVKRDMEARFCSADDVAEDNGVIGNETRGIFSWISPTAQALYPVPDSQLTPAASCYTGAFADLTEASLRDLLQSQWNETGMNGKFIGLCGSQLKRKISDFSLYAPNVTSSTAVRTYQETNKRQLSAVVDIIEGDFGVIELFPTHWLLNGETTNTRQRSMAILDLDMWSVRFNERPTFHKHEDKGGGPRGLVSAIAGLVCRSPKGQAKVQPGS